MRDVGDIPLGLQQNRVAHSMSEEHPRQPKRNKPFIIRVHWHTGRWSGGFKGGVLTAAGLFWGGPRLAEGKDRARFPKMVTSVRAKRAGLGLGKLHGAARRVGPADAVLYDPGG